MFAVVVYLHSFPTSNSVSLWHRDGVTAEQQHLDRAGNVWTSDNRTWTSGSAADGDQAAFTGQRELLAGGDDSCVVGGVIVPNAASGFHGTLVGPPVLVPVPVPAPVAPGPLLLCEDDAMTFTASGEIFSSLLVDRGESFELGLLEPGLCGSNLGSGSTQNKQNPTGRIPLTSPFARWRSSRLPSPAAPLLWVLGDAVLAPGPADGALRRLLRQTGGRRAGLGRAGPG